jgi:hypothetical protein
MNDSNKTREIVILQRGWIIVGDVVRNGSEFTVTDASVIRRWGTTNGIGQLAIAGPTKDTILDPVGTARAHELTVVMRIDVQRLANGKWAI